MPHAALLAALLPPVSYAASGPHLAASLQMEGRELDRLQENAAHAVGGLRPFLFQEWLEEYERVYGLPGPCSRGEQLLPERIAVLAAALLERGGISAAWIRRYAPFLSSPGAMPAAPSGPGSPWRARPCAPGATPFWNVSSTGANQRIPWPLWPISRTSHAPH